MKYFALIFALIASSVRADISNLFSYDGGYSFHCTSITKSSSIWADSYWYAGEIVQFNIVNKYSNCPIDWEYVNRQKNQHGPIQFPTIEEILKALQDLQNR